MFIIDTLRMMWMLFWRTFLFMFFFIHSVNIFSRAARFSFFVAIILRIGLGVSIRAFPIIRAFGQKTWFEVVRTFPIGFILDKIFETKTRSTYRTSQAGSKIGGPLNESLFSPRSLQHLPIPVSPLMYGTPGAGLSDSGFDSSRIALGQTGEQNFAKALALQPSALGSTLINDITTFWSVAMPSAENISRPDRKFDTDIDCIAIAGSTVYLIDLKFYESDGAVYSCSGDTLIVSGKKKRQMKMTRNMAMASDRFKKAFPNLKIKSRVVFVPTSDNAAHLMNVKWPGNIPAVNLSTMLSELTDETRRRPSRETDVLSRAVQNLLK